MVHVAITGLNTTVVTPKTIKAAKFAIIIVPTLVPTNIEYIGKPHGKTEVVCYVATHVVRKKIYAKHRASLLSVLQS